MAHANRNDDSFQDLPPLRRVGTFQQITDPVVSPGALNLLGSYTGETMAICAYASPIHPALVAYDYQDGSVRWTSPSGDLPGFRRRLLPGILMAKMGFNGNPVQSFVFACNWAEFVAYTSNGRRMWKRATAEITQAALDGIGIPRSLRYNDAKELVTATSKGWIVKLNPRDGSTIGAYKMDTNIVVRGRVYQGTFISIKSPVVIGNVLYLVVRFEADPSTPLPPMLSPVHIVRIQLNQAGVPGVETVITPLTRPATSSDPTPDRILLGVNRSGASASAWVAPDGNVLIFAHTYSVVNGRLEPTIVAVEDDQGVLSIRWRCVLNLTSHDDIHSAPALHPASRTLLVTTRNSIYVFRNVDALTGNVPSPLPLGGEALVSGQVRNRAGTVGVGSPFALTLDAEANEIVAYTNFRVAPRLGYRSYGFLGAFALPARGRGTPHPLWCCPLAVTAAGAPAPGPGTFGQPALFRYRGEDGEATGLIVNTVCTGTYLIK
jgi:hypothetical protein